MVRTRGPALFFNRSHQPSLLGPMDDVGFVLSFDHLFVDHDLLHVAQRGQVIHRVEQHVLQDRAQAPGARLSLHRLSCHGAQRVLPEVEFDAFHVEQFPILLGERVLRLQQDRDQRVLVQLFERRHHRQAADELGNQTVLDEIFGLGIVEYVVAVRPRILFPNLGHEADPALVGPVHDDLFEAGKRTAANEQDVRGVDLQELLLRVLAAALGRNGGDGAFDQLQQRLLHTFAGNVAGDGRIVGLTGDLVDLVDVDDAGLRLLDIVVAFLQQLLDDVFDVLAHIARLGQGGGVGDGERNIEKPRQRFGQQGLAGPGGPYKKNVALGEFDLIARPDPLGTPGLQPLVMVVDGDRQNSLGPLLTDDVFVQDFLDFLRLRKLVARTLSALLELFPDDVVAQFDALVADEYRRAG